MSNIDLSQLITAEDKAAQQAADRAGSIKALVQERIFSVVDLNAQTSLLAAGLAGTLSADDAEIFKAGQQWIEATKAEGRRAAIAGDDPVWPEVPDGVAELAKLY